MGSKGREASQVIRRRGESLLNDLSSVLGDNICTWVVSNYHILRIPWCLKYTFKCFMKLKRLPLHNSWVSKQNIFIYLCHAEHARKHNTFHVMMICQVHLLPLYLGNKAKHSSYPKQSNHLFCLLLAHGLNFDTTLLNYAWNGSVSFG